MYPGPRGYPGPAGYPPMYPPYGYPPPPPMMNRTGQHRGRGDHGNQRSHNRASHESSPHRTTGGNKYCKLIGYFTYVLSIDAPRGRKTKAKLSSIDYAAHASKGSVVKRLESLVVMVITGEQMIGYGPDIAVDDKDTSHGNHHDEDPDFHPLPPPITKGIVLSKQPGLAVVIVRL